MKRLGMPVSDTTILAGLRKYAGARSETGSLASSVRVAGVDDWAWRKGHKYGTIIVDLERRAVVDVLADRSAGHRHVATRRARADDKGYRFSCGRNDLAPCAHRRGAEHAV